MKNKITRMVMLLIILISVTSCSIVKGIFEAGVGVGVFIVVIILAIIVYAISKIMGNK
jgi:predicted Na+-dependent transporter